ncbi:MAG: class I SAM-dependent methyltransferase [Taibaiella sp.]|nr:class I SAM-dependent methyltransferase [Taibaiella sp.]
MEQQKNHWEKIYSTKRAEEVSWTQVVPKTSLDFIHYANLNKSAKIIDVGGGDSRLVDYLLDEGFEDVTILDISEQALIRAKKRLGKKANKVNWIISDITEFQPANTYDFWHDRAAFHFLTTESQIVKYISIARQAVKEDGYVTIGTFSTDGPQKCSGLDIKQYSEETLTAVLENGFYKMQCVVEDHITPFDTTQNFVFCSFRRKAS